MLKNIILWLGGIAVLSLITGCSVRSHQVSHEYLGHIPDLEQVDLERNEYQHKRLTAIPSVKNIGEATLYNTAELEKHIPNLKRNVIVTSIVDVDNLKQSSDFGRLYSDSMITNFKRLGWNVIDYRGINVIAKSKQGEFYLDRDALKSTPDDSVIFVGTYGHYNENESEAEERQFNGEELEKGLLINVRLLDKKTNYVLSASNVQLNDSKAYELSQQSNCTSLECCKKTGCSKNEEEVFNMMLIADDCKNAKRCECENPDKCLGTCLGKCKAPKQTATKG